MSVDDRLVMVGTTKGLFLIRPGEGPGEPLLPGSEVASVALDRRAGRCRLMAGATSFYWGSVVRSSDDLGQTWTDPEVGNLKFPADTEAAVARIWQLTPAGADEPDVVYAGVEPAAIFRSDSAGEQFELLRGLWDHPHRATWMPGGGGLCLHTILVDPRDPNRLTVAISTGGVYISDDRGESWRPSNQGIRAEFMPEDQRYPEYGQCVHKVVRDEIDADRLFAQNHFGLYRSDDGGGAWHDIANGVPSDFGFPMVAHPGRANTVYIIPLNSPERRWSAEERLRVYRTTDGSSWAPLTNGLPERAYTTVLRDAFATDGSDPAGLYFGTRGGEVFASSDEGESWSLLADHLPPILCVRAAVLS